MAERKVVLTGPDVAEQLVRMLRDKKVTDVAMAVPFITKFGAELICDALRRRARGEPRDLHLKILTRLDPEVFLNKASDLSAIETLAKLQTARETEPALATLAVRYRHSLHAKIYLSPCVAIIGSANLTEHALEGYNDEAAVLVRERKQLSELRQLFDELWKDSTRITQQLRQNQKQRLEELQHEFGEVLKKIEESVRKARIGLQRFPVHKDLETADYFSQLQEHIRWLYGKNGSPRRRTDFIGHIRETQGLDEVSPLPEQRVAFLEELRLVATIGNKRIVVTYNGRRLCSGNDRANREWFFKHLLRWCEKRIGDHQFRVLLRAFQKVKPHGEVSLEEWAKQIPLGVVSHWWGSRKNPQFRENTCIARGWLTSLQVLEREGNPAKYRRGRLFPKRIDSVDIWLNSIVNAG